MIPYVELNEIFRQSMESLIVTNAHKIVKGIEPEISTKDNDFFFLPSTNKAVIEKTVIELCNKRLPATYNYNIYEDIQILAPGRKGELGVTALNTKLQQVINPPDEEKTEITASGKILRTGDKVMQIKNN